MAYHTQHLLKRTSGFYFRLVVPKHLRLALGKSEIRHPLRTSSEFIAVQWSKRFWSHYQSVFESLTMKRSPIDPHVMSFGIAKMTVTEGAISLRFEAQRCLLFPGRFSRSPRPTLTHAP